MENTMNLWGIGPALAFLSVGYGMVALAIS